MHLPLAGLLAAAAFVPSSMAHYCFNRLIVNDEITGLYEFVRINTNSNSPITQLNSTDLRCNAGGLLSGNETSTYKVAAGDQVGFALDTAIGHPGPLQVYMSKAPGKASEYDGSGDWFKVYELGVSAINSSGLQWASSEITNFTFTLPSSVPSGQYFLRVEHIALHGAETFEGAQFYISCAQIEVTAGGEGTPEPVVDIPGVYTGYEPGLMINIYWPTPTNYTMPGPAVWPISNDASNITGGASATVLGADASTLSSVAASSAVAATSVAAATLASTPAAGNYTPAALPSTFQTVASTPAAYSYSSYSAPAAISTPVGTPIGTPVATPGSGSSSGSVAKYGQCGGQNYSGARSCESGSSCVDYNVFYSQCVPSS